MIERSPCEGCMYHMPNTDGCQRNAHGIPCAYPGPCSVPEVPHRLKESRELEQATRDTEFRRALDSLPLGEGPSYPGGKLFAQAEPLEPCQHDPISIHPERTCSCPKTITERQTIQKFAQQTEGVKFDAGKPRYDLYPPEALEGTTKVLTFGAVKYADRNWEKGMSWGRVFGACMRHLWAWWKGEDTDPESGLPHLDHAACCIAFLQTYSARRCGTDDRGGK